MWYIIVMAVALVIVWAVERYRRKHKTLGSQVLGMPETWEEILQKNVPIYRKMPVDLQAEVQELTMRFIEHKKFVACGGLAEITDEIKVTIAGNAVLLVLNRRMRYPFAQVYSVLVYPSSFFNSRDEESDFLEGEAWPSGSVVVAWDQALKSARELRDGKNLIVHEFAHQLDMENGEADGLPLLDYHMHGTWARVLSAEFRRLQEKVSKGKRGVIDVYGADDPAEFFAVITEAFFERSDRLKKDHPELYEQLRLYYRIDPVCWDQRGVRS